MMMLTLIFERDKDKDSDRDRWMDAVDEEAEAATALNTILMRMCKLL